MDGHPSVDSSLSNLEKIAERGTFGTFFFSFFSWFLWNVLVVGPWVISIGVISIEIWSIEKSAKYCVAGPNFLFFSFLFFFFASFVVSYFVQECDSIRRRVAEFSAEFSAVCSEEQHVPSRLRSPMRGGRVALVVGGHSFFSSVPVLASDASSFFASVLDGFGPVLLHNDALFIDRDPAVFQHVLDFLTRGTLALEELASWELEHLAWDAHFYELAQLSQALGSAPRVVEPQRVLLDENEPGIGFEEAAKRAFAKLEVRRSEARARRERILRHISKAERCMQGKVVSLQAQSGPCIMTLQSTLTAQDGPLSRRFARSDLWSGDDVMKDGSVFVDENHATLKLVRKRNKERRRRRRRKKKKIFISMLILFLKIVNLLRGYCEPSTLSKGQREALAVSLDFYGGLVWNNQQFNPASRLRNPVRFVVYFFFFQRNLSFLFFIFIIFLFSRVSWTL